MLQTIDYKIILLFLSAIIVFIYSIDALSKQITTNGGNRIRVVISRLSKNPLIATFLGAISTAIVQSSSAVTSITVILVSTGFISFKNSLGIILGANIGTTVTAQLALIDSTILGPLLITTGFLIKFFGKRFKPLSKVVFFLGFVLFSLNLLSTTLAPIKDSPEIIQLFSLLDSIPVAVLIGMIFTIVVQSSSITTGILIILASARLISTDIAIAIIVGANIGSSSTALLVSGRLDLFAKRTAVANFLFNMLGALIILPFIQPFTQLVVSMAGTVAQQTAIAHLLFNVANTALFLILLDPFAKLITTLIKGDEEELLFKTKYINNISDKSTKTKLNQIKKELGFSIEITKKIFSEAISLDRDSSKQKISRIEKLESLNDYLDDEISNALIKLSGKRLAPKLAEESIRMIQVSNTIEQLGDLGKDYADNFIKMNEGSVEQDVFNVASLEIIHRQCQELFAQIEQLIMDPTKSRLREHKKMEVEIEKGIDEALRKHHEQITQKGSYTSSFYVDALSILELATAKCRAIRHFYEDVV